MIMNHRKVSFEDSVFDEYQFELKMRTFTLMYHLVNNNVKLILNNIRL
jgi:hypothetical protein